MHSRPAILAVLLALSAAAEGGAQTEQAAKPVEENYKLTCQPCHMPDGNAALEPMNLADGKWKHGTSVKEIAKVIADGVPATAMMPFKARFSEQEILELARYVRTFDKNLKPEGSAKPRAKPKPKQ